MGGSLGFGRLQQRLEVLSKSSQKAVRTGRQIISEKAVELVNKLFLSPTYSSTISAAEPAALNG